MEHRERVATPESAANDIIRHEDILNENFVVGFVLGTPRSKRHYYEENRFYIETNRKDNSGILKKVVVRVAENTKIINELGEEIRVTEYVLLVVHVERLR
ncbi:MAG: hypothetical protein ACYCPP_05550 [Nitrososphaerales archaeon]